MIAVWYHCKISGSGIPDSDAALRIVKEQMDSLNKSGLSDEANEIHVGLNGSVQDGLSIAELIPDKAVLYVHGHNSRSELSTFAHLRQWIQTHSEWMVLYHHSKGVTQPNDDFHHLHRRTMEKACVWNWKICVKDLSNGYDAVGINLVDPVTRPVLPGRFFAGNFWWARAQYLLTLPSIPEQVTAYTNGQRCIAEMWIGRSKRRPVMMDYERPELYANK